VAGIRVEDARRMLPGFIMDMFKIRATYDGRMAGLKLPRKLMGT